MLKKNFRNDNNLKILEKTKLKDRDRKLRKKEFIKKRRPVNNKGQIR